MNNVKTMPWLTDDMQEAGLTETVINYLTGKIQKLPKDISWSEFFYLWSLDPDGFPKTAPFKKLTSFLKTEEVKYCSKIALLNSFVQVERKKELLLSVLPVEIILQLTLNFWDFYHIRNRARTNATKEQIVCKLRSFASKIAFKEEELSGYYQASKGFPEHLAVARTLIQQAILAGKMSLYKLKSIPGYEISHEDADAFIVSGKMDIEKLIELFEITGHGSIIDLIRKKIESFESGSYDVSYALQYISASIRRFDEKEIPKVQNIREEYLPLIAAIVLKQSSEQLEQNNILPVLPAYNEGVLLTQILTKLRTHMRDCRKPGWEIQVEEFVSWYSYSKEEAWIELCIKSITTGVKAAHYAWWNLKSAITAYELCKDPRIITEAINCVLPKTENGTGDDAIKFYRWVKNGHPEWWTLVQEAILKGKQMHQWFEKDQEYRRSDKNYIEVLKLMVA